LFSGGVAYSVCNYLLRRKPASTPLKEVETIDVSKQGKKDVATSDGDPVEDITATEDSYNNADIGDDPKQHGDMNKFGNDQDHAVNNNPKEAMPYLALGLIGFTVVVICSFYCYSVSKNSDKSEYGTLENPFYLFDAEKREEEDKGLKHGKNGNFDINELFFTEFDKKQLKANSNFGKMHKVHSNDFALKLLEKTYFKISPKDLLKILDYDDNTKNKIMGEIIKQKDGNGNISFYVSKLDFKDVSNDKYSCEARLKIVVFKDSFAEGDCLRRHVLADKDENSAALMRRGYLQNVRNSSKF